MPEKSGPLRWLVALILVVPLLLSSASGKTASAAESPSTPSTQPAPTATPAKPEAPTPEKTITKEGTTETKKEVDKVHDRLEQGILGEVIRLDNFFGARESEAERKTGYRLQLRDFVRVDQMGNLKYGLSVRGNMTLSKISDRLSLYFSGDNTPEQSTTRLPEDPGNPGFDRPGPTVTARIANTELRFGFLQTPATYFFLGTGFTLVLPPETFVRTRIQHTHHINDVTLFRAAETLFVNNIVGLGETTELSLDRLLNPKTLLRLSTTGTISKRVQGVELGAELSLSQRLSEKSSMTLAAAVNGITSLDNVISNYGLLARYRRNFLMSWLFYETGPDIVWLRQIDGQFLTNYGITFALEVAFKGSSSDIMNKPVKP